MKPTERSNSFEIFAIRLIQLLVILAAFLVVSGGLVYLYNYGSYLPSYNKFHAVNSLLRHPASIMKSALQFQSTGIIQLGILLLIAIPVIRVIMFLLSFILEHDWLYSGIALIILAILFFSLTGVRI